MRNGSGTYSRAVSAYVYGTIISQTDVNAEMDDIATALTASLAKDGQTVPTANLPMGGYKLTGLGSATVGTDALALGQMTASGGSALVGFLQSGTGATARTVQSKLLELISVKDFGVVGDGVTDDTAAIQATVDAAREVYFPSGTYKITSSIVVPSNTTIRCAANVTIDISGAASGSTAFYSDGSFGSPVSLSGNAAVGAMSLSVAAGAEAAFAADDWIQIYSTSVYDPGWTAAPIGEIVQVASTASGTINLKSPLVGGAYNTADSAALRKCNLVENIHIVGGYVVGSSTPATIHTAVKFSVAYNCHVDGLRAKYCNGNAITVISGLFCSVRNAHITDALDTNTGYGVNVTDTSQDCTVTDSTFARVRHAVTNTGSDKGLCRRITYQNLKCYNTINTGDAFDTHANGEDIVFDNCISYDAAANGFNIECGSAVVRGCKSIRSQSNGIALTVGATVKPSNFAVQNCDVDTAATYGIRANQGSTVNSATTERVSVVGCSAVGVQIGAYLSGNASVTITNAEVIGGYYSGTSANGAVYVGDYVQKFKIANVHGVVDSVGDSCFQLNGSNVKYGALDNNIAEYSAASPDGAGSSACFRLTNVSNISLSNNIGRQTTSAGGYGIRTTGTVSNIYVGAGNNMADCSYPGVGNAQATLTIATGVVALPHGGDMFVTIDTEASAASDDLDTINGGVLGQVITLQQANSARDPTIKDTTGNLRLAGDFIMTALQDSITLKYNGTAWVELARADIA